MSTSRGASREAQSARQRRSALVQLPGGFTRTCARRRSQRTRLPSSVRCRGITSRVGWALSDTGRAALPNSAPERCQQENEKERDSGAHKSHVRRTTVLQQLRWERPGALIARRSDSRAPPPRSLSQTLCRHRCKTRGRESDAKGRTSAVALRSRRSIRLPLCERALDPAPCHPTTVSERRFPLAQTATGARCSVLRRR